MSKRKTQVEIIRNMGLSDPDGEIEDCMTEWADRVLSEYKESLKAEIQKEIEYYKSVGLTASGKGYLESHEDCLKLINGPL